MRFGTETENCTTLKCQAVRKRCRNGAALAALPFGNQNRTGSGAVPGFLGDQGGCGRGGAQVKLTGAGISNGDFLFFE